MMQSDGIDVCAWWLPASCMTTAASTPRFAGVTIGVALRREGLQKRNGITVPMAWSVCAKQVGLKRKLTSVMMCPESAGAL